PDGGAGAEGGPGIDGGTGDGVVVTPNPDATGNKTSRKVDVVLVVDNSASMGDKASYLAQSAGKLVEKIAGTGDIHLGISSSSLGSFGGDVCTNSGAQDRRAHFQTTDKQGAAVPGAAQGF